MLHQLVNIFLLRHSFLIHSNGFSRMQFFLSCWHSTFGRVWRDMTVVSMPSLTDRRCVSSSTHLRTSCLYSFVAIGSLAMLYGASTSSISPTYHTVYMQCTQCRPRKSILALAVIYSARVVIVCSFWNHVSGKHGHGDEHKIHHQQSRTITRTTLLHLPSAHPPAQPADPIRLLPA